MEVFRVSALLSWNSCTVSPITVPRGGSQVLTDYMTACITSTANDTKPLIQFNKRVTSISQSGDTAMNVYVRGESNPRTYSHIISTIPLPCLQMVELGDAGLNVMQKNALRKLQYGRSVKVGIRFRTAWWTELFDIIGGKSTTDLPIRTIIYPSHGAESSTPSTVLIASYCWLNDAERLGTFINTSKIEYEEQLKELVLRNLAEVHGLNYNYLLYQYVDMHAWDWSDDPLAMGEFLNIDLSQLILILRYRCLCIIWTRRFSGLVHISHRTKCQQEAPFRWRRHQHPPGVSEMRLCHFDEYNLNAM